MVDTQADVSYDVKLRDGRDRQHIKLTYVIHYYFNQENIAYPYLRINCKMKSLLHLNKYLFKYNRTSSDNMQYAIFQAYNVNRMHLTCLKFHNSNGKSSRLNKTWK